MSEADCPSSRQGKSLLGVYLGMGLLLALVAVFALAWTPLRVHFAEVDVLVLRHHPSMMGKDMTPADPAWTDRIEDWDRILVKTGVSDMCARFDGGGSGYELRISSSDLSRWQALIDGMFARKELRYYTGWGLDGAGFGLVPMDQARQRAREDKIRKVTGQEPAK